MYNSQRKPVVGPSSWSEILGFLREELGSHIFEAYISPLELAAIDDAELRVLIDAPSSFVKDHVAARYKDAIARACNAVLNVDGIEVEIGLSLSEQARPKPVVVTRKELPSQEKQPTSSEINKQSEIDEENAQSFSGKQYKINPRYRFDNFIVGASNEFAHAAALKTAEEPGEHYNPLFIYSGVGLGKTHLLHAIGNSVLEKNPDALVVYLSSETFTNDLIRALRHGTMDTFKKMFRSVDLLLIDDVQFMSGKERTQEEFFHTFNVLYNSKQQIVITCDQPPNEIIGLEDRLKTRLAWGLTADLQAPDFETRVAILKKKALSSGATLPEDVAAFVANAISSNVRELEGALTRLVAMSSLRGVPLSINLAESALEHFLKPRQTIVSIDDIKRVVAQHFSINVTDMCSKRRTKNLSFPRQIAMYLSRKHTTCSYPEIGQHFGGRDHSSVIHGSQVVSTKLKKEPGLQSTVGVLEEKLLTATAI